MEQTKAHSTSFYARRGFKSESELDDWILRFYAQRLAFFAKNMDKETIHGVLVTPKLLKNTKARYLTLLMRKHNVTNGQLPRINQ